MTQKEKQPEELGSNTTRHLIKSYKQVSLPVRLFLFVALLFFGAACPGQPAGLPWSAETTTAHRLIMRFSLQKADSVIKSMPPSPEKAYLLSQRDFLSLVFADDRQRYEAFLTASGERISWVKQLPSESPERAFYLADIALQEALLRIKYGEYLSGLYSLWQANAMVEEHQASQFQPLLKPAGVIHVLLGLAPGQYRWVLSLLGLEGDLKKGLAQLTALANSSSPMATEATLILGYFYIYPLQEPEKAVNILAAEHNRRPGNQFLTFLLATSLSKAHRGSEAVAVLQSLTPLQLSEQPFARYLMADLLLQQGNAAAARALYTAFLSDYTERPFRKDVLCKIAVTHLLEQNTQLSNELIQKAAAEPAANTEPDKNAEVLLSELPGYPIHLLRARFYSDGGYWEEALRQLATPDAGPMNDPRWACEHFYRLARIKQLTKNPAEAVINYKEASRLAEGHDWYIGAAAALQTGLLLRELGEPAEAAAWFRTAMKFRNHPYKTSIDAKAELELASLQKN